ncbi:MAG: chloride channel protein [Gomphosphaeria aponina SAG 52.96 = DSM 107014]|uniref:Chloride channel protein n=1 Tax=Gomphosphaeria aponina SAG 52.96 = DSM 107014 TaxID=1521640 RepID=A0A941JRQ2_9CHRO|nr:chloride channel protein [Gomphosphaeria aponina SAG 52.96 = DSM 107014]
MTKLYLWIKSRHFARSSISTRFALIEACLIGLLSALAALFVKEGISWVGALRLQAADRFGPTLILPLFGLTLGMAAGWLIEQVSVAAAGGGIPPVKAALARFPVTLSLRVAIVKAVGTILVLGSGLTLGRRAPTVHIGAALAAQLSSWLPTPPEHRRQMIAAGAAAGLAAGFDAPIAGVMFVVEELMRDVSGLTLETAILASFIGAVVGRRLFGSDELNISVALMDSSVQGSFSLAEIPFYLILGIAAGIFGALFNRGILFSLQVNRRLNLPMSLRIGMAGLISGLIISFLPSVFNNNAGLRDFLMSSEAGWQTTAIAFVAHFFLSILAAGTGAPGGLFVPALILGAALGDLVGTAQVYLLGINAKYTYVLAGMGAFFTAVVRAPFTAIIIVFEMTADFNLVLPLMIGAAVAYFVAESFSSGSLDEHILKASGIELKDDFPTNDFLNKLKAADVMQSQVETLSTHLTLDEVKQAMSQSHHRGFPVVEDGKLVGIVTQSDLTKLDVGNIPLKQIMTPQPVTIKPNAALGDVLYLLNRYKISRLPVIEGNKLVGIITRSDIIRVEVNQLSGKKEKSSQSTPSFVVYQTRSPEIGKGRILLPISNPHTAPALLKIAGAIARSSQFELECLQVIPIPKHSSPAETSVNTQASRKLMRRVERFGRNHKIPVHTQIRVSYDIADTILSVIRERHIDLLLMGWKGRTSNQDAIFGNLVDKLINAATCELILVKLSNNLNYYPYNLARNSNWLVPMAGGPNAAQALKLLPALTAVYQPPYSPIIWLCRVYPPAEYSPDPPDLKQIATSLQNQLNLKVISLAMGSHSVINSLSRLATNQNCDVVILGASREGLLKQVIQGNIPEAIATQVDSTVILVRTAIS